MHPIIKKIYANNGDGWTTPASTIDAFWSALGAGANGLWLSVYLTKDKQIVCAPAENIKRSCDIDKNIINLTLDELQSYDAGSTFRSTKLDADHQPTGDKGQDLPWQKKSGDYPLKERKHLFHPSLQQIFELFSRRTKITLQLPPSDYSHLHDLLHALIDLINKFGVANNTMLSGSLETIKKYREEFVSPNLIRLCLDCREKLEAGAIHQMVDISSEYLITDYDLIDNLTAEERESLFQYTQAQGFYWIFCSKEMPYAPTADVLKCLSQFNCKIEAWQSEGALSCKNAVLPNAEIFSESFSGNAIDPAYWSAGYSHINFETKIEVNDSLTITINEGESYSGGAAICLLPIHGNFDAEVCFHVENPHQATTFELAAIGIDPGYHHLERSDLNTRSVNLTFDVHGAPPYASSERDQNDGFRCGWNNSFNFARIGDPHSDRKDAEWMAASVNMYNKYGRDVGDGSLNNPEGKLRLVRNGAIFNTYYQDKHNDEWVCSGSMLVQSLPKDCYLRLAAKHWHKIHPAPPNRIRFWNFKIQQPVLI